MKPIFHTILGYPTVAGSVRLAQAIDAFGPAYLELQIPFSDPLADGEIIMSCSETALQQGASLEACLQAAKEISASVRAKCLFVCYYNTIYKTGVAVFCRQAKEAGVVGLIVADYSAENESVEGLVRECRACGLAFIPVVTIETPLTRLQKLLPLAGEFVYCTARLGITSGEGAQLTPALMSCIVRVREVFGLPVAVGFGISRAEEFDVLRPVADFAVVGSAIARRISSEPGAMDKSIADVQALLGGLLQT
jgi:tryptophan synthase alpha chain